jgi:clan AA aspartic protease (TIGR02281 family)
VQQSKTGEMITMKKVLLLITLAGSLLFPPTLFADGTYLIGRDKGGVYMETDQDGSWYIDPGQAKFFKVGEEGSYSLGRDDEGAYITTNKHGKFYIDREAQEQMERQRQEFNEKYGQAEETETKVIIEGNRVLVPVTLGYDGRETQVLLLLDTGASSVLLHREVAEQLKTKEIKKGKVMVVGGKAIDAELVKLKYVQVGPIRKENVAATVIDHQGPPVKYQGLLGMNFLKDLEYKVDSKKQIIKWGSPGR